MVGAGRFRNPDADLPADFAERRAECYERLGLPTEARAFTDARAEMTEVLGQLDRGSRATPVCGSTRADVIPSSSARWNPSRSRLDWAR